MKISRAEDYAITLVAALASRYDQGFISLAVISREYALPEAFLKHIARTLKSAGLLAVKEGRSGGYRLARNPATLPVGAVLKAFNPAPLLTSCMLTEHQVQCPSFKRCASKKAWQEISRQFYQKLNTLTFGQFTQRLS